MKRDENDPVRDARDIVFDPVQDPVREPVSDQTIRPLISGAPAPLAAGLSIGGGILLIGGTDRLLIGG